MTMRVVMLSTVVVTSLISAYVTKYFMGLPSGLPLGSRRKSDPCVVCSGGESFEVSIKSLGFSSQFFLFCFFFFNNLSWGKGEVEQGQPLGTLEQ